MLKQILRDMYVDPEILAGLDETYKQILFCKMREEQIRRWRIWDEEQQKLSSIKLNNNKNFINNKKNVSFRLGDDGEPWVWVMGEHKNDLTIDQILEDEAKQKARQLAETEFRKMANNTDNKNLIIYDTNNQCKNSNNNNNNNNQYDTTMQIQQQITTNTPTQDIPLKIEDYEIYCSVDELKINNKNNIKSPTTAATKLTNIKNYNNDKIDVLQEISYNKPTTIQKVSARIALWEQRTIGQRTSEIFKQIQKKKQEIVKEAEETAKRDEELWKEQERKAKQAEIQMREIARRAREEHRKSLNCDENHQQITTTNCSENSTFNDNNNYNNSSSPLNSLDLSISRPPNQDAVINWYRNIEFPKNCGINIKLNKPEKWFHGFITRNEAERLLLNEEQGTFLIRLSEKIWGYAISYKDIDRCKHYLIDASNNNYNNSKTKYKFLGQNQLEHDSLDDLLQHHASVPITILGNELLLRPCPSTVTIPSILKDLLQQ